MTARRVALITGAARGIGAATALALARRGYNLALLDVLADELDVTASEVRDAGGEVLTICGDLADLDFAQGAVEQTAARFGRLDVLVNNAGVGERSDFRHLDDAAWDKVWKTNVDGTVRCAREAFALLKASGKASVINLSSVMATKHTRQMSVYSATKGAVSALSRSLAVEYAPYGIRVNALCPGYVETALIGRYMANPMIAKALLTQTPLRRFGTPQDIANAALFLASDEAAYITGADLHVDGGMSTTL
jgi:NAD(P)-dependent dehydrogenase (short-subunit alcohol dehydrogenase family)